MANQTENHTTTTLLRGMEALQSALQNPGNVPIFRERWGGGIEPITLREATALAVRGRESVLLAEVRT